jgi:hypothetical protein
MKKNTEALVDNSKETGLRVNADKTEYMVRSRDQNAGRSHIITTDNNSFECVEHFKFWGTTLANQNSIREENKGMVTIVRCRIFCFPVCYLKI